MNKFNYCLLALALLTFAAITGCEKKELNSLELIKKRGILQVAVFGDNPPFGYIDSKGQNQGFDIGLAKRLAKELLGDSSKIEFIIVDPAQRFVVLENDKADVVIANFTRTPERAEKVDFTHPYIKVSISVASPKTAPIRDVEELNGKKLIVTKSTVAEEYFRKNHPEIEIVALEQLGEIFKALKDGRGAALAEDNTVVAIWAQENPGFEVGIGSLGSADSIAPAVKKGNVELRDFINRTIEKLSAEQFLHANFEATFRTFVGPDANADDFVVEVKRQ